MNPTLTERDIYILRDLARFQLLSTKQIAQTHFPDPQSKAAANRMRRLKMFEFVTNVYAPLTSEETKVATRPASIWLFPPSCQKKVQSFLENHHRASDWDTLSDEIATYNREHKFSQQSLIHEVGISEVFLALEAKLDSQKGYQLPFLIRTSPRHDDISCRVDVPRTHIKTDNRTGEQTKTQVTEEQTVNPDAFVCVGYPDQSYTFTFFEFDNGTSSDFTFVQKLEGYYVYLKQGRFAEVCKLFSERYNLGIRNPEKASFRVVTIVNSKTNAERRLYKLFAASLRLPSTTVFNFATLADFQTDPYGSIMVNKRVFEPLKSEYIESIRSAAPTVQRKWFDSKMPALTRESWL